MDGYLERQLELRSRMIYWFGYDLSSFQIYMFCLAVQNKISN